MFAERKRKAAASMLVLLICYEEENKKMDQTKGKGKRPEDRRSQWLLRNDAYELSSVSDDVTRLGTSHFERISHWWP